MYGNKKDYKKINFYDKKTGKYICSTTWARTCKQAMEQYTKYWGNTAAGVRASYK